MDDLEYTGTETPGFLRNGAAIPETTTARMNDSMLLRAFKRLPLSLIRKAAQTEEMAIKVEAMGLQEVRV